jgi:hypothetical protein
MFLLDFLELLLQLGKLFVHLGFRVRIEFDKISEMILLFSEGQGGRVSVKVPDLKMYSEYKGQPTIQSLYLVTEIDIFLELDELPPVIALGVDICDKGDKNAVKHEGADEQLPKE